jgi:hypothetical protein
MMRVGLVLRMLYITEVLADVEMMLVATMLTNCLHCRNRRQFQS